MKRGWAAGKCPARRRLTKGFELAEHAIEIGPQQPFGYQVMANIYLLKGEHDRAVAFAEKSADLCTQQLSGNLRGGLAVLLGRRCAAILGCFCPIKARQSALFGLDSWGRGRSPPFRLVGTTTPSPL